MKTWRNRTKLRMVEAMGGGCCLCGYNRTVKNLQFHHLDPSQKDFGFAQARADIRGWHAIVDELRKCVLLCNRCHIEVHEGIAMIPPNAARFDEAFAIRAAA